MSLTTLFRVILSCLVLFILILLVLIFNIQRLQNDAVEAEERRYESYRLAERLRQSSDDLTRMARSFACSGSTEYLDYYQAILDIRNGKADRPANYTNTYWYLFPSGLIEPKFEKPISLVKKMQDMGFSTKELELLKTGRERSDDLVELENEAFSAMKGQFKDENGEYTIEKDQNPNYARQLLFSNNYDKAKVTIMKPIQDFLDEVDERTRHDMLVLELKERMYIRYAIALLGGFIVIVPFLGILLRRRIMVPLTCLVQRSKDIAEGNYSSDVSIEGIKELSVLNDGFNEMSDAIKVRLNELKRVQDALQASENNLKKAHGVAKIGSWYLDNMQIIHLTDEAIDILDLSKAGDLDFQSLIKVVHPEDRDYVSQAWNRALKTGNLDVEHRVTAKGEVIWLHLRGMITLVNATEVESGVGTLQDITLRKESELRDKNHRYVLELIANGTNVHTVLDTLLNNTEDEIPQSMCCIMIADPRGSYLRVGAAPSIKDELKAALDGIEVGPGSACCGAAAFSGESVIVEDVRTHPYFHRLREPMKVADLRACWSFPIMAGSGDVLGTLAIYLKQSHSPDAEDQKVIHSVVHLAGIALSSARTLQLA
ncbi:MAG: GAF domain-containing protein [Candidatus Obscuribacterales bacterium]|nr:GAF domain-containing protein [Candidatus Obscuribacterales bacterium]